jgi:hypothetical protein
MSQNQDCLQPAHQGNHCRTISCPSYGSNEWCCHVMKALCGWFWTCHALLAQLLAKSYADFSHSQAKTKVVSSQHTKATTAGPFHSSIWVQRVMLSCISSRPALTPWPRETWHDLRWTMNCQLHIVIFFPGPMQR